MVAAVPPTRYRVISEPDAGLEPPHSVEAEQAVLAIAVQGGRADVLAGLEPSDFYVSGHRAIAAAIRAIERGGGTPTHATVVAQLQRSGERSAIDVLATAFRMSKSLVGGHHDARLVAEHAQRRRLIDICRRQIAGLSLGRADGATAIGELQRLAEREAGGPDLRVWTPPEIWAPIPPPVYALGTITRGDVAMLVAHGGSLKSWIAVDAIVAKASGTKWLDRFQCEPGAALYLDNEMGADECRRRMQRCALARGSAGPIEGVSLVSMPGFTLTTPEGIAMIRKLAEGRALMAIDSLAAFCPDVDENDARFADPLKRMKDIGEKTGCAFSVLHHSRKAREGDDERERPRGTSALFAACDAVFQLSRAGDGFVVRQTKARKGKSIDDMLVRLEDTSEGATRVYATEPPEAAGEARGVSSSIGEAKAKVLRLVSTERDLRSANEIHRRTRGAKKTVLDAIRELEERGLISKATGAYALASEVSK